MDPQHPQRFPRVVRGHRQRDMSEKALGAPADDTQADAVSEKPKRTGVMQDPNWSLDRSDVGHPGIDIPVDEGTPFFAVGDGRIVSVQAATDGLPGNDVKVLLSPGATEGTGWAFIYEHVNLDVSLSVGSQVSRGQVIARSATSAAFTNHFELSDLFNGFRFHQNQTCWVPQLDAGERARLQSHFDNVLRTDPRFIDSWLTDTREGQLPFRELLNTESYPSGAQLCYPRGTDVRVPAS